MTTENKVTGKKAGKSSHEEVGIVLSNKMSKTIVVKLDRRIRHGKYGKFITKTKKVKAHDEQQAAKIGDQVLIVGTRPLSREKRYALKTILRKATGL
jgi:small subunit ribosomal protein S17